jgi:hypothetical protein
MIARRYTAKPNAVARSSDPRTTEASPLPGCEASIVPAALPEQP